MQYKNDDQRKAVWASLNEINNSKQKPKPVSEQPHTIQTSSIQHHAGQSVIVQNKLSLKHQLQSIPLTVNPGKKKQEPKQIKFKSINNFLENYYDKLSKLNPFTKTLVAKKGKIPHDQYLSLARTETWIIINYIKSGRQDFLDIVTDVEALKKAILIYKELHS